MNLFQTLPDDIKKYIIPFTYKTQPIKLQEDIIHFHNSYAELKLILLKRSKLIAYYNISHH